MNSNDVAGNVSHVLSSSGEQLAYRRSAGRDPTVVFLSGYASDMSGAKAMYLESVVTDLGFGFLRFDYSGHGLSDGDFVEGCIGQWAEDALSVIRHACDGPVVLIGSSMGGWIMLLVARALGERVRAMVGIAAAPDFTEQIWNSLNSDQREALSATGEMYFDSDYVDDPYPVTFKLIEDGRAQSQLSDNIPIGCPVRLLHGMQDPDVPWRTAVTLAERLNATDVQITLLKAGGHRLSDADQLTQLAVTVRELLDLVVVS